MSQEATEQTEAASEVAPELEAESESVEAADAEQPTLREVPQPQGKALRLNFSQRRAIATRIVVRFMEFLSQSKPGEPVNVNAMAQALAQISSRELHTPPDTVGQAMEMQAVLGQLGSLQAGVHVLLKRVFAKSPKWTEQELAFLRSHGIAPESDSGIWTPELR